MYELKQSYTYLQVQGQTIKQPTAVVVDMKFARNEAQVYVMLSRAQKLSQIYIIEKLHEEKWRASQSGLREYTCGLQNAINVKPEQDKKHFELVSVNISSLRKHHVDLERIYENKSIDCICLQETWLPENDDATHYKIKEMIPHLNSVGRGRGVATYCSEEFILRGEFVCEQSCQLIKVRSDDFDIINVYRSQDCSVSELQEKIKFVLDPLMPTIMCGDTNIDITKENGKNFLDFMQKLGLKQLVMKPTHEKGGLIDHVYATENLFEKVSVTQKGVYFSDHDLIIIKLVH